MLPVSWRPGLEAVVTAMERVLERHQPIHAGGEAICRTCRTLAPCSELSEIRRGFEQGEWLAGVRQMGALSSVPDESASPAWKALNEFKARISDHGRDIRPEGALALGTLDLVLRAHPVGCPTHHLVGETLSILRPTS